jgi:nucleotide-binding universal stress UspA family protein
MEIKDILLYLRAGAGFDAALALAVDLARRHGAGLAAVCACAEPVPGIADSYAIGSAGVGEAIAHRNARIAEALTPVKAALEAAASRAGIAAQWAAARPEDTLEDLAVRARLCDLAVLAAPARRDAADRRLAELVALGAGTPCLLAPDVARASAEFAHVVLAWDGSREAKRALTDGLTFLKAARRVTVAIANGEASPEGVTRHLANHGVICDVETPENADAVGGALLRCCAGLEADLLIMGAYGHARAAELILGGATRTILAEARLPVLLSH